MKTISVVAVLACLFFSCNKFIDFFPHPDPEPEPLAEFNKVFGGQEYDAASALAASPDSGYLMVGSTQSNDFDAAGHQNWPSTDGWIVKLDKSGAKLWHKTFGGSGADEFTAVAAVPNGGYVLAGASQSNNADAWIVRINAAGTILWQKTLGGSAEDRATAVVATADDGCVMAGYTYSNDGDIGRRLAYVSAWVVKLDGSGNIEWQKLLGGTKVFDRDMAYSITTSKDNGYVVAGRTYRDTDSDGNFGNNNVLVAKLDKNGQLLWRRSLGGLEGELAYATTTSSDGGYIAAGAASNSDYDENVLVMKLNADGTLEWQKTFGGSLADAAYTVAASADGGCLVASYTESNDGDVSGYHGDADVWLVRLDGAGNKKWQKALGGSRSEWPRALLTRSDGSYVMAATTESTDGDIPGHYGESDAWITTIKDQ